MRPPRFLAAALLAACATFASAEERVSFPSFDGAGNAPVVLSGFFFAAATSPAPAIAMFHGCGGAYDKTGALARRMRDYAELFNGLVLHVLVVDSLTARYEKELCTQRNGTRRVTQANRRLDALGAIAYLADRADVDARRIGLIGWSYGAATAIQAAAEVHDVAFVIADSSYSSLGDIARAQAGKQFGAWAKLFVPGALLISGLRAGFDARDVAPANAIRDVQAPVLLIHSRQDRFTPVGQSERIYAHSNKNRTRLVIPAWEAEHGHSFTNNRVGYTAVVDRFLKTFGLEFGVRLKR